MSNQGAGAGADERVVSPVRLPFSIRSTAAAVRSAAAGGRPSWGKRLGVWWAGEEEGESGVVVTGLLPGGPAARGGAVQVGDVVAAVEGAPVTTLGEITRLLEGRGPGPLRLTLRRGVADERTVVLEVPPEPGEAPVTLGSQPGAGGFSAQVPVVDLMESLKLHIELILSSPLQSDITHPGVAADPDFGCLGADLQFSLQRVGLSEIRNAVLKSEPRLRDVEVEAATLEVREEGERVARDGLRITGVLVETGRKVQVELEIDHVRKARQAHRRRTAVDAGVEGK